jgi:hypothetical protein
MQVLSRPYMCHSRLRFIIYESASTTRDQWSWLLAIVYGVKNGSFKINHMYNWLETCVNCDRSKSSRHRHERDTIYDYFVKNFYYCRVRWLSLFIYQLIFFYNRVVSTSRYVIREPHTEISWRSMLRPPISNRGEITDKISIEAFLAVFLFQNSTLVGVLTGNDVTNRKFDQGFAYN